MSSLIKVPNWILNLIPADLKRVLNDDIHSPTTSGRKTAIDDDNVNDFVYYAKQKKTFKGDQFEDTLKGTSSSPFAYSKEERKFKCMTYFAITKSYTNSIIDPFHKGQKDDIPQWYKYVYLSFDKAYNLSTDTLYDLFMNCPKPVECLNLIFSQIKNRDPNKLLSRKRQNKENDINFYKNLSEKDKDHIIKYINDKKIILPIADYILEEGNLERILLVKGCYTLAEYCNKNKKIDEFKQMVDAHREYFKNLKYCDDLVRPQFKDLYTYAYSKTKYINNEKKKVSLFTTIRQHVDDLIKHNCDIEIKFMISKGWKLTISQCRECLNSLNQKLIALLTEEEKSIGMDALLCVYDKKNINCYLIWDFIQL